MKKFVCGFFAFVVGLPCLKKYYWNLIKDGDEN